MPPKHREKRIHCSDTTTTDSGERKVPKINMGDTNMTQVEGSQQGPAQRKTLDHLVKIREYEQDSRSEVFKIYTVELKDDQVYENGILDKALTNYIPIMTIKFPRLFGPRSKLEWHLFDCIKEGIGSLDEEFKNLTNKLNPPDKNDPANSLAPRIVLYGAQNAGKSTFSFFYLTHFLLKNKNTKGIVCRMNPEKRSEMDLANQMTSANRGMSSSKQVYQVNQLESVVFQWRKNLENSIFVTLRTVIGSSAQCNWIVIMDQVDLSSKIVVETMMRCFAVDVFPPIPAFIIGSGGLPPNFTTLLTNDTWHLLGMRMKLASEEFSRFNSSQEKCDHYNETIAPDYRYGLGLILQTVKPTTVASQPSSRFFLCQALASHAQHALPYIFFVQKKEKHSVDITDWMNEEKLVCGEFDHSLHMNALRRLLCEAYIEPADDLPKTWRPLEKANFQLIRPHIKMGTTQPPFRYMLPTTNLSDETLQRDIDPRTVAVLGYDKAVGNWTSFRPGLVQGHLYEDMFYLDLMYLSQNGHEVGVKVVFNDGFKEPLNSKKCEDTRRTCDYVYHECRHITLAEYKANPESWRKKSCHHCELGKFSHVTCYCLYTNMMKKNFPGFDYIHITESHSKEDNMPDFKKTIIESQFFQITINNDHKEDSMQDYLDSFLRARQTEMLTPENGENVIVVWLSPMKLTKPKSFYFESGREKRVWCVNAVKPIQEFMVAKTHDTHKLISKHLDLLA